MGRERGLELGGCHVSMIQLFTVRVKYLSKLREEQIMSSQNRRDVSPNGSGGWKVTAPGRSGPTATARTQRDAEAIAKDQTARAGGGQVYIHTPKGVIRDADTVKPGNESRARDTRH